MTSLRKIISTALSLAALTSPLTAHAQNRTQDDVHFSAIASLGLPFGDLANASDIGVGLAVRAEGRLSSPGWSLRADLSWDRFNGKGTVDSYSYLGAGAEMVHRDAGSRLYEFAGLGLYNSKVNYNDALSADHTNLGMQGGVGFDLQAGGQTPFVEFGLVSVFNTGGSSVWVPVRIGIRF